MDCRSEESKTDERELPRANSLQQPTKFSGENRDLKVECPVSLPELKASIPTFHTVCCILRSVDHSQVNSTLQQTKVLVADFTTEVLTTYVC